jgi:hypothetical protein
VTPTADPERTAGRPENAAARPRARMIGHDEQADPGQTVPAEVFGPPAAPARTVSPAGQPGLRPATGQGGPRQLETPVVAPGPGAVRAGPPVVTADVAGMRPLPVTADPRLTAEPAARALLVRSVPPTVATGAEVLPGHARMARAGTMPAGVLPARAVSGQEPTDRRIGRSAIGATPLGGRHVTGRQDPRATEAVTGPPSLPATAIAATLATAPATATVAGIATAPVTGTAARAATEPGVATVALAATEPGAAAGSARAATAPGAASAPGPDGTRLRPSRPARAGRGFRTRSLPSNSIASHGPS